MYAVMHAHPGNYLHDTENAYDDVCHYLSSQEVSATRNRESRRCSSLCVMCSLLVPALRVLLPGFALSAR